MQTLEIEVREDDDRKGDEKIARPVVPVDPGDTPREKYQPWRQKGCLPVLNSILNLAAVVVVAVGVWVANKTLVSIDQSVAVAKDSVNAQREQLKLSSEQLKFSSEQFTAAREAAWLDQRPWLGFSRADTEPDEFTQENREAVFRFRVLNSGKTAAFRVRFFRSAIELVPNTHSLTPPLKLTPWNALASTVFPNQATTYSITIRPERFSSADFKAYTEKAFHFVVTARLEYCDANRRLHWTQFSATKRFSQEKLPISHSTASRPSGEPDQPVCQDEASRDP